MFPAKEAVTVTEPLACFTEAMVQLAEPEEFVVPLQVCAVDPEPRVKMMVCPAIGVPLDVKTPDNVADCPFTSDVVPVYLMEVAAAVTTTVADPLLEANLVEPHIPPEVVAVKVKVPAVSVGVMEHDALPELFVVAEHVWVPLSVNVTVAPDTPAPVWVLVSVADTVIGAPELPDPALTVNVVAVPMATVEAALDPV